MMELKMGDKVKFITSDKYLVSRFNEQEGIAQGKSRLSIIRPSTRQYLIFVNSRQENLWFYEDEIERRDMLHNENPLCQVKGCPDHSYNPELETKKWKDTVPKCHCELYCRVCNCSCDDCNRIKNLLKQAETTWEVAFEAGKQEGRKEAVEWVEGHCLTPSGWGGIAVVGWMWQEQKKVWGIE